MSNFHLVDSQGWEYDLQSVRAHIVCAFIHTLTFYSIGLRCIHGIFSTQWDTLASGNVRTFKGLTP